MIYTLVDVAELKNYIEVADNNTTFDSKFLSLAGTSTRLLETYCRASFSAQEYTQLFSTRGSVSFGYDLSGNYQNDMGLLEKAAVQRFPLKGFPVNMAEPISVWYDSSRNFAGGSLLNSNDIYINEPGNALYLLRGTGDSTLGLKVTYTAGYAAEEKTLGEGDAAVTYQLITGAPDDLKMACVTQTMFLFNKIQENNIGMTGGTKHSPQYVANANLLCPEAQALAAPYRRSLVGRR